MSHSVFQPNPSVMDDGTLVAVHGMTIMWAGQITGRFEVPLTTLPEGCEIHCHPNLIERIRLGAERREPGGVGGIGS